MLKVIKQKLLIFYKYARTKEGLILLTCALIGFTMMAQTLGAIRHNKNLDALVVKLNNEIEVEQLKKQNLEFKKKYASSPEYAELTMKEKFNKALPGENVILVPTVKPWVASGFENNVEDF
ncbi:MAG: hypothetical protein WAS94_02060 [Candidatus Saccharimonadales bacterium]